MSRLRRAFLGILVALGCAQALPASAAALFVFRQEAGGVFGVLSGSLDLAGLVGEPGFSVSGAALFPGDALLVSGEPGGVPATGYLASGPSRIGTDTFAVPVRSGLAFTLATSALFLDSAYQSGTPVSGSMVFAGATFASLGVDLGDHVWTLGNDETFTLSFVVPEPGALPLLAGALGLLGLVGGRRRRRG